MNGQLRQLVRLPKRVLSLLIRGSGDHAMAADSKASKPGVDGPGGADNAKRAVRKLEAEVGSLAKEVHATASEIRLLREEMRDRLLQYNLQLGHLAGSARNGGGVKRPLSSRSVALSLDEEPPREWTGVGDRPHPDPEGREWLRLEACPICGHRERTIVNEWNKLILMEKAPDQESARYDFAVCHACGISYATRRPFGARYKFLLENFGEVTAKHAGDREFSNPLLNPYPLTDGDREQLRRLAARGVFVSEHPGVRPSEYLKGLLTDRFANSVHLDLIGALVSPHKARVLEIRPRTGMILEGLRRLYGADVCAMPIWESQQFLMKEVYGIDSPGLVDYDEFDIPYAGQFDLIICNHMLTHAVRPERFFAAVRRSLKPGGYIYFYNEPDDAEYLTGNQSMLATLNPLHMQTFDVKSFVRGLAANGLEVTFHRRRDLNHISLARFAPTTTFTPMSEQKRDRRIRMYRMARDRSILVLRGDRRARFADEWPRLLERGVADGLVEFDAKGELRVVVR